MSLKRRVESLGDGNDDVIKFEDIVLALDADDPDAAVAELNHRIERMSPKAQARLQRMFDRIDSLVSE